MLDPKNLAPGDVLEALETEHLTRAPHTSIWTRGKRYRVGAVSPDIRHPELTKFDIEDDSQRMGVQTVEEVAKLFRNVTAEVIAHQERAGPGSAARRLIAYIDESGQRGYERKFSEGQAHQLGLMASLIIPCELHDQIVDQFRPGFERFRDAAPAGARLHITDAWRRGNDGWATVAEAVREEFFNLIRTREIPIIYDARRVATARARHALHLAQDERLRTLPGTRADIPEFVDEAQLDHRLIEGLLWKLKWLAGETGYDNLDLHFDGLQPDQMAQYVDIMRTLNRANSTQGNPPITFTHTSNITLPLDAVTLNTPRIVGKDAPLILAVDMVANSLNRHLKDLPADAPLNIKSATTGWTLADRVLVSADVDISDIL